ncbi:alpha/beta fold hydrolase [Roseateles violae]|uniref:Cholesterol oxidase n=1 Tax=Roseateles violae TaxID=3058042 RepID=A0ABT8DRV2_9BURK|nr:alpha/beta fold hydrolase [Pelomonas sp. PFR6]MDN3919654.1 alpha/beta fold hydrolase [Pelomonas sp. PFR6]
MSTRESRSTGMPEAGGAAGEPATRWLTIGLEVLLDRLAQQRLQAGAEAGPDFDVLIVGSGYGGATAAAQLSECVDADGRPLRIAVLERGREYLGGQFPATMAELPGHVRFASPGDQAPRGRREGLFDLRLGPDMCVALANGLGGGSLINAGVMEPALDAVFAEPAWPSGLRAQPAPLRAWYEKARRLLGAVDAQGANTIDRLAGYAPRRADWLAMLDADSARRPPITMALAGQPRSAAGLELQRCRACGDCATGCNHGAKQSLDTNLLLQAQQRGVQLVTGAGVLRVLPASEGKGWRVELNHTDEFLQRRQLQPLVLTARRVVLAAGSLGSTEILLRSRAAGLAVSDRLGERFSGNGDVLAAVTRAPVDLNALADEAQEPAARGVGPTITAMLDQREAHGFVVQDLAIPGPLRWLFEEGFALASCLDGLARGDERSHGGGASFDDPHAITAEAGARMLPLAIIGSDAALGRLSLADAEAAEGTLAVDWPGARSDARVDARHAWLQARLRAQGGRLLANPLWRLLPAGLQHLLGDARGPMISVHPLGGCAMGDSAAAGVVDEWGRVFCGQGDSRELHEGLVVLDGAIVPGSLGINPALTITALALRALDELKRRWGLREQAAPLPPPGPRPRASEPVYGPGLPTLIEIRERMGGFVELPGAPGSALKYAEFSFIYAPTALKPLLRAGPERRLRLDHSGGQGRLRIFDTAPDPDGGGRPMLVRAGSGDKLWMHAERADADALAVLPLRAAELRLFARAPRTALARRWHGLSAWFRNRGWRDSMQFLFEALGDAKAPEPGRAGFWRQVRRQARDAWALASHAGELRLMEYEIELGEATAADAPAWLRALAGQRLRGAKRISYTRRGNPWKQLSSLQLDEPGPLRPPAGARGVRLELCLFYLARERVPLLRLTQAQDSPSAIRDVGSLLAYIARMLIALHVWSFRKPDAPPPREIRRLPAEVPGLPAPEITELAAGRRGEAGASRRPICAKPIAGAERPVMLRLTRYRAARPGARPILMLHGYSASGTTFAHHSVQPGPAKLLWDAGWDVWLLDMRTSAGMPTATLPWTFEEAALNDIPLAVDHVVRASGFEQIDVFAHCMGSVMLHMALLEAQPQPYEHFYPLRQRLQGRIRRLVISQVTPKMIFSPTNTLRAFMMQHIRRFLPLQDYAFRVEGSPGLVDQLLDRLLASLPYPDEEFDIENPPFPRWKKTPWTGTRHRMDLLYGRDFAIKNVDQPVFDFIDDHFGPLNMDTVAQAVNFARSNELTDWRGASVYLDDQAKTLAMLRAFPVLSVHGLENGLCQSESGELTADHYAQVMPKRYRYFIVDGHGHQDCLIGRDVARTVFPVVIDFLREDEDSAKEDGDGR